MNNLIRAQINEMARRTGTQISNRHYEILGFAHEYYEKNRVGPLFPNIKRNTGATKEEINELFPFGLKSVFTWVGVPIVTPEKGCKPMAHVEVDDLREVYLDHNATTYVRDEVRDLLIEHFSDPRSYGNASSSTELGKVAYNEIEGAREQVARLIGATANEIVFCGCGSEANNHAIKGLAFPFIRQGGRLITSAVEHSSVLESLDFLEDLGFEIVRLPIEKDGRVSPDAVLEAINDQTRLVSIMAVNNEIGTINPLAEIGAICREAGVPFLVDAIQGFGKIPIDVRELAISALVISGHKIYAPKGVAAVFLDNALATTPLVHGGSQELGRRAGTENVAYIRALGLAADLIERERVPEQARLIGLRDSFLEGLRSIEPGLVVNGTLEHRVGNNLNVGFPAIDSGSLLLSLNRIGVYISAGSACHAGAIEASHVIKSLGVDPDAYGSVRFSFGMRTTQEDLDYVLKYLPEILRLLREEEEESLQIREARSDA